MTKNEEDVEDRVLSLLEERKFSSILDELKKPANDSYVSENVWNLINSICLTVKESSLLRNDEDVIACKRILLWLVDRGNPKEVLVSLLEQADSFKDHEFFCLLLDPLQATLKKTPGKRGKSLQWVLSTLNAHIETLPEPDDLNLEDEEMILLDALPAVKDAHYLLTNYLAFIEFFVDEVSFSSLKTEEIHYYERICHQRELLQRYILKLFYRPLLYHDLHVLPDSRPKSTSQKLCESYMRCLSKMCHNVFNLFKYDDLLSTSMDEDSVPSLAFANLSYLIFVEHMAVDFQPFVHSHLYTFMEHLEYITLLLEEKENLVRFKGLSLAEHLLDQLEDLELNYDCIELEAFMEFPKLVLTVAIYCDSSKHRSAAIKIFKCYMSKCNHKGRYHLILQILTTINNTGAESLVIVSYKDNLHEALNGNVSAEYFLGKNFKLFVKKLFFLSEGVETDLVLNGERMVTSLNFLRYILLRDKREVNTSGIWDLLGFISKNFMTPLRRALDFSRAHYEKALLDAEAKTKKGKGDAMNTTVECNGELLPNMSLEIEKDIYRRSLMTFEVIESVLSRVKELMSY